MNKIFLAAPILLSLAGCSGGTAKCNDGTVKQTVMSIIESNVQKAVWGKELYDKSFVSNTSVSNIKTTSHNDELDSYTCAAQFDFEFKGKSQSVPVTYELSYLEDQDDTEVSVYGVDDVKSKMMSLAMYAR